MRWFGYIKRIGKENLAKKLYDSDVRSARNVGRPRKCWKDKAIEVLARKGLDTKEARDCLQGRG